MCLQQSVPSHRLICLHCMGSQWSVCGPQVFLNGERLPIKSFQEYVGLYISNKDAPRVYERVNERWEVCVLASEGQFHQARAPDLQKFVKDYFVELPAQPVMERPKGNLSAFTVTPLSLLIFHYCVQPLYMQSA